VSNRTISLDDHLYDYLLSHSLREPDILKRLREETSRHEMARMQISPEQGQFMALMMQIMSVRRVIEVGVFTGYSSLCMALALPADAQIIACDINPEWTAIAQRYWHEAGVADKIDLRLQPALATLQALRDAKQQQMFDFAFIDADKGNYLQYYELCLQLLRPGGVIAIDNVLWSGDVADETKNDEDTRAIRQLNEHVYRDERVDISLLPIGDGLTLARRKIPE
jgi:predicted O-methyltransferase YrrM